MPANRPSTQAPTTPSKRVAPRLAAIALALTAVVTTMLIAFALPNAKVEARDLPLAIAAPPDITARIEASLDATAPGAFEFTVVADADAAHQRILDRKAYGAIVVTADGATVETASAASTLVATMLTQVAQGLAAAQDLPVTVVDVTPFPAEDPRGAGLAAGALPLAVGGLLAGAALSLLVPRPGHRLAAAAVFTVAAGFSMMAVLRFWVGTFDAHYVQLSLAATLGLAATAALVMGCARLFGRQGIALGAALIFVLGNPLSGLTNAPELLPRPWGTIGQLLPPGATGTLLRNVGFFDGAGIGAPATVLGCWFVVGLGLYFLAGLRGRATNAS